MKKLLNTIVSCFLFFPTLQASENYCLAIRGNGEAMPAHWGAMSQVIQKKGMPKALAGGSSASISLFLLDSLAANPRKLTNTDYSLLVKSFQGYFEALTQTKEGKAIAAILADKQIFRELIDRASRLELTRITPQEIRFFKGHLSSLQTLLNSYDLKGLINPEFEAYVKETIYFADALGYKKMGVTPEMVEYRKIQISHAIKNFGSFNAAADDAIFFRPGLISFTHLANVIGIMGDFYAGIKVKNNAVQNQIEQDVEQFLKTCSPGSEKLTWSQLSKAKPTCQQLFVKAVLKYRTVSEGSKSVRIQELIGSNLAAFPTTAVLTGEAVIKFRKAREDFRFAQDLKFGRQFQVSDEDVHFGYWGDKYKLRDIGNNLRYDSFTRNDKKSQKFLSLGSRSWLEALATSPAEPGLSALVDLNQEMVSAGGWSDLHPTLDLKAYGCEDVVYLTRKGGESFFAQGVMKRLTNYEGFEFSDWFNLSQTQTYQENARGNSRDQGSYASSWSQLYNMANGQSSIRLSMRAANSIVCTDWDSFDPRKQLNALVENAFLADWLSGDEICR